MPSFNSGRITTNAIFYNRGVPNRVRNFGAIVSTNFEVLKSVYRFNKKTGRPIYSFM
jgi:hypothetical protein